MAEWTKWDRRFMELAATIGTWSSCYQENRHIGAVIVRNKRIITTGYNGAPAGIKSCVEKGECMRRRLGIPSGTRHELCYAIHAEQNAIIQAAKLGDHILHPPALRHLCQDDSKQRHIKGGIRRGLPRPVLFGNIQRGRGGADEIRPIAYLFRIIMTGMLYILFCGKLH